MKRGNILEKSTTCANLTLSGFDTSTEVNIADIQKEFAAVIEEGESAVLLLS